MARIDVVAGIRGRVRELWAEHQDRLVTMLAEEFPNATATELRLGLTLVPLEGLRAAPRPTPEEQI